MKGNIVFNGGEALEGCPTSWNEAQLWAIKANENNLCEHIEWSWDCGYKLDFDGGLLRVVSRFYPPKTHYGNGWDGSVSFYVFDKEIKEQSFKAETLDQLKEDVEFYVKKEAQTLLTEFQKPKGINLTWHVILFILGFVLGGVSLLQLTQ